MKRYLTFVLMAAWLLLAVGCGATSGTPAPTEKDEPEPQTAEVPGDLHMEPDWGITLTAKDVTPTGLTIVCTQSGGEPTGELQTGSYYFLETWDRENWTAVEELPHNHEIAWTMEAWGIPTEGEVEWEVDWQWLYGELPAGTYRIGKELMDFRGTGDYDKAMFFAQFDIL